MPLVILALLAGFCIFFTIATIMYLVYRKTKLRRAKKKCFRHNGGLLLQEHINANKGVRFKIFLVKEIERATNNFHEDQIRGRGGQGIVYEGNLDDKRRVAVKKSLMIDENMKKEFAKEMCILSLINHKNVIQIFGCCLEVDVPMVVYEFMPRGTLYQHIHNKNQRMTFSFRLKMAIESASALAYLHADALPSIVHGDVKSSNILLDDDYNAKVSDFGSSFFPLKVVTDQTGVPGTFGYLDPESLQTGQLTEKSDVYSFAVVVLELFTRKKAVYSREKKNLAQTFIIQGLREILDDEIKDQITQGQVTKIEELLKLCLRGVGEERPKMIQVVAWLRRMNDSNNFLEEEPTLEHVTLVHDASGWDTSQTTYSSQHYTSDSQEVPFELDNSRHAR